MLYLLNKSYSTSKIEILMTLNQMTFRSSNQSHSEKGYISYEIIIRS